MSNERLDTMTGEPTVDEFVAARRALQVARDRPLGVCGELELSRNSITALARAARGLSRIDSDDQDFLQCLADWLEQPDITVTFTLPPMLPSAAGGAR